MLASVQCILHHYMVDSKKLKILLKESVGRIPLVVENKTGKMIILKFGAEFGKDAMTIADNSWRTLFIIYISPCLGSCTVS